MKKQIRANVFETNSSSTHSVTIDRNIDKSNLALSCADFNDQIVYDKYFNEERILVPFGAFGWEVTGYDEVWDKLQYVATMLLETYCNSLRVKYSKSTCEEVNSTWKPTDIYETDDFHDLDDAVYNATGYDWHICFDKNNLPYYEEGYFYHDGYCFIDHQSCENYYCLQDWLNDWGLPSIEYAIFNPAVTINTDNDNY